MKQFSLLIVLLFATSISFGQKSGKIKGSRMVTIAQKEIGEFENLEVEDNIEVFLIKGDKSELEIEADDNLHDAISITSNGGNLRLSLTSEVYGVKKLSVKITYTSNLKMIIAKGETSITSLDNIDLENFTIKTYASAKVYANVKANIFTLLSNDKSRAEINITANMATIELSKSAQLKALISSSKLKLDMYQKTLAVIEGDVVDLQMRLDNNANCTAKNLTAKDAEIVMEGYSNGSINVATNALIDAAGKSELELFGEPKIVIRRFTENAILRKKTIK